MEIRQIQSFVTITQTGSFSGAAQLLGYSQSAITVQIRLLEEELGVRLFDRMGKKIGLTSQGKRFLLCADEILKQVQMAGELKNTGEELKDPLHIGTLTSICFSKFPPILQYFREHHPRVPIRITTASPGELIDMMEHNQLDLVYLLDRDGGTGTGDVCGFSTVSFGRAEGDLSGAASERAFSSDREKRKLPQGAGSVSGIQRSNTDSVFGNQQYGIYYTYGV